MNATSFFSAAPTATAPAARPETPTPEIPRSHAEAGSFSHALREAASAKERGTDHRQPVAKPSSASSAAAPGRRDGELARSSGESSATAEVVDPESGSRDDVEAKEPDRATLEAMACLCAAAVVTLPVPVELNAPVGGVSSGETAKGELANSEPVPTTVPTVPLSEPNSFAGPVLSERPATAGKPAPLAGEKTVRSDGQNHSASPSPETETQTPPPTVNSKTLLDLVKPMELVPLEKTETPTLTPAQTAALAAAAQVTTAKAESAKADLAAAEASVSPPPDSTAAEQPVLAASADVRRGTPAAQREADMRKTAKRSENAEVAEQKLPGRGNSYSGATESLTPGATLGGIAADARSRSGLRSDQSEAEFSSMNFPTASVAFAEASPKVMPPQPASVSPADRVQSLMTTEVSRFKQMKLDSMSVVLRPDAQTEISVSVRMNDGRIEAQAVCERGDFNGLNAHWGQLQQALSRQQVELAPLREAGTQNGNADHSASRGFAQSQGNPQPREEKPAKSFLEEFAPVRVNTPNNKTSPRPVVTVSNGRQWESWA